MILNNRCCYSIHLRRWSCSLTTELVQNRLIQNSGSHTDEPPPGNALLLFSNVNISQRSLLHRKATGNYVVSGPIKILGMATRSQCCLKVHIRLRSYS